jgi:LasA protease
MSPLKVLPRRSLNAHELGNPHPCVQRQATAIYECPTISKSRIVSHNTSLQIPPVKMHGSHRRAVLLVILISLILTGLASSFTTAVYAQPRDAQTANIEKAVIKAVTNLKGSAPTHGAFVDIKRVSADNVWAFGSIALLTPKKEQPKDEAEASLYQIPEGRLWLARLTSKRWEAAIDFTPVFDQWLQEAPLGVMNAEEKAILGSGGTASLSVEENVLLGSAGTESSSATVTTTSIPDGQFSLPWTTGQTWRFSGGPHGWAGTPRPWSSLDFAGGDGRVRSARGGLVYRPCGKTTWVQVRHRDGWITDYYHLTNIPRFTDGSWIKRGKYLGNISTTVACGGSAMGAHVHFNIRYKGSHIAWHGRKIGGWTMYEGAYAYGGYAVKNGTRVYPGQLMYNNGNW